jgi:hypothetical protein
VPQILGNPNRFSVINKLMAQLLDTFESLSDAPERDGLTQI